VRPTRKWPPCCADAIGLNFYSRSKRFVTHEQAKQIAAAIPADVKRVGVL